MNVSEYTTPKLVSSSWLWMQPGNASSTNTTPTNSVKPKKSFGLLQPLRQWLDQVEVNDPELAHRLCELIPAQCPFERDVKLFGRTLFHIPPLCKLNPLYDELVALRFRALCYLADECGEDISSYC
ncbi:MAG TPA: Mo-dependent nitrogenase C-terminal domain-containing protein [Coleofasciculaceae cyanobacterium]